MADFSDTDIVVMLYQGTPVGVATNRTDVTVKFAAVTENVTGPNAIDVSDITSSLRPLPSTVEAMEQLITSTFEAWEDALDSEVSAIQEAAESAGVFTAQ